MYTAAPADTEAASMSGPTVSPSAATNHRSEGASAAWHTSQIAKAQHALSVFASLKTDLQASGSASPLAVPAWPPGMVRRRTSVPTIPLDSTDHSRALTSSTAFATPSASHGAGGARAHHRNAPYRGEGEDGGGEHTQLRVYSDAELEAFTPPQLRHQLRVAAAVTERLHQRTRQLGKETEMWKQRCAELEKSEGKSSSNKPSRPPSSSSPPSPSNTGAAHATSVKPTTTSHLEQRCRALEREVQRLGIHKEELRKNLYLAEKTTTALREEIRSAAHRSSFHAADTAQEAVATTVVKMPPAQPNPKEAPVSAARDRRNVGTETDKVEEEGVSTRGATATSSVTVAVLRDTVHQLQQRLDVAEAQVQRATHIQLQALLHRHETEPPSMTLINAEVQKLFQLMQEQLVTNAVQQQAERARMNEILYMHTRQGGAS